ncbi:hypothetical protein [Cohnella abietis]|uniref:Deoxyhypusine synthase n=1 Tax=Cohnella abietis TaxID=2507935 RepID=A0A3T1DBB8_9BACL|nr:hypothetical protein [Cohnella abietis]BBI35400.1 hypothetical protein KCTCHS21_47990 [Cohnella abietis]
MKRHELLSFDAIKTCSVHDRENLVTIRNMAQPYEDSPEEWPRMPAEREAFDRLIDSIIDARVAGKPVIWSMGAHVIKNGMSRYVIEMVRHGIVTHVSGNGATSIHDFELAFLGETSENVASAIEDGSFGMWEETGRYMNEAIQQGASDNLGYGESLYHYLNRYPERFPHYDDCVFAQCQRFGVPYTCHISIGTDIIHQHPIVDFEALGQTSGKDFNTMCQSVAEMVDGGVFLNFGSAISGPEIFLKATSICRNEGLPMTSIVAANFDIVPVYADHVPPTTASEYYYRPRRNFIDRLGQIGGEGYLFHGLHQVTIPQLFHRIVQRKRELGVQFPPYERKERLSHDNRVLYPIAERRGALTTEMLERKTPYKQVDWAGSRDDSFHTFIDRIHAARDNGGQVIVSLGGNVIGSGVSTELIELIEQGFITHLALNGAGAFQDLELAAFAHTEEIDTGALASGRLGMWKEPGKLLHQALKEGYDKGLGYGESLIDHMKRNPGQYPYSQFSLLSACGRKGIPCTVHITLGTDSIHQHPDVNFSVQGGASGRDFQIYANTVTHLDGGVYANFGSTVTGPEVLLKALSIARNLGHTVSRITTANFDIVKLGDYHRKVGYEDWDYYYRPRKNIIHRPTSLGGDGFHFEGLHQQTIPAIRQALTNGETGGDHNNGITR